MHDYVLRIDNTSLLIKNKSMFERGSYSARTNTVFKADDERLSVALRSLPIELNSCD